MGQLRAQLIIFSILILIGCDSKMINNSESQTTQKASGKKEHECIISKRGGACCPDPSPPRPPGSIGGTGPRNKEDTVCQMLP